MRRPPNNTTPEEKMHCTNIPKSSGIYHILSKETDRQYVGSSINLRRRKKEHFEELSKGTHYNSFLQRHVNKYGADDLKFGIIELCPRDNLIEREQYYIDSIQPDFNLYPTAYSRLGAITSEETKKKLSEAHKGQIPWMTGRKHTEESKQKMSEAHKGQIVWNKGISMSEEQKKKMSAAALTGRKHTEESKQKISAAVKGQVPWNKGMTAKRMAEYRKRQNETNLQTTRSSRRYIYG